MLFLPLLSLCAVVSASLYVTNPIASTTGTGGATLVISWLPQDTTPAASLFGPTTVGLFTGSTSQQTLVKDFGTVQDPVKNNSLKITIDPSVGPDSSTYFIRFQSVSAKTAAGIPLQSFSSRFALTKMTGSFSSAASAQNGAGDGSVASGGAAGTAGPTATNAAIAAAVSSLTFATMTSSSTSASSLPTMSLNVTSALPTTSARSSGARHVVPVVGLFAVLFAL